MLKNVYEGLNARPKVYLLKEYSCEMYPTCVSSKLCEFIFLETNKILLFVKVAFSTGDYIVWACTSSGHHQ